MFAMRTFFSPQVIEVEQGDTLTVHITNGEQSRDEIHGFGIAEYNVNLVMDPGDHPSFLCRFEPTTLISVLSASTRHIGLGATVSTSFGEPYHVARTFASSDAIDRWLHAVSSASSSACHRIVPATISRKSERSRLAAISGRARSSSVARVVRPRSTAVSTFTAARRADVMSRAEDRTGRRS